MLYKTLIQISVKDSLLVWVLPVSKNFTLIDAFIKCNNLIVRIEILKYLCIVMGRNSLCLCRHKLTISTTADSILFKKNIFQETILLQGRDDQNIFKIFCRRPDQ